MFVSVLSILHERLPCAYFYFRQRRELKRSLASSENGDVAMNDGLQEQCPQQGLSAYRRCQRDDIIRDGDRSAKDHQRLVALSHQTTLRQPLVTIR